MTDRLIRVEEERRELADLRRRVKAQRRELRKLNEAFRIARLIGDAARYESYWLRELRNREGRDSRPMPTAVDFVLAMKAGTAPRFVVGSVHPPQEGAGQ